MCVRQLSGRESRRVLDQIMKGDRSNCLFFFVRFFSLLEVDGIDVESTLEVIIANICLSHFIITQ